MVIPTFQQIDLSPTVQGLQPLVSFTAARRSEILPLSANVACQRTLDRESEQAMQHGQTSWTNLFSTYSRISTGALPAAASRKSYRSSLPEDDEYSHEAKARSELEGELGGRRVHVI